MTVTELAVSDFTKQIYTQLSSITGLNIVLSNPSSDSEFPCAVISTPYKRVKITEDGIPIKIDLSVAISYWASSKYSCMDLSDDADIKLRNINLTRVNTTIDTFDEITKKYRYGGSYETTYNALTGALENIR